MNKFLVLLCCFASLVSARPDVSLGYKNNPNYNSGSDLLAAPFTSSSYSPAASGGINGISVDFLSPGYNVAGSSSSGSSYSSSSGLSSSSGGLGLGGSGGLGFSGSSGLSDSSGLGFSGPSGLSSSSGLGYSGSSGLSSSSGLGYSGSSGLSSSGGLGYSGSSGLSSSSGLGYSGSSGLSSSSGLGFGGSSGLSGSSGLGFGGSSGLSGSSGLGFGGSSGLGGGYTVGYNSGRGYSTGGGSGFNSGLGTGFSSSGLGLGGSSGYNTVGLGSGYNGAFASGLNQGFTGGVNQAYSGGVNSIGLGQQYAAQFQQQAPIITKNFYVHSAPEDHDEQQIVRYVTIGRPLKNYRVLFINAPSSTSTRAKIIANVAPVEDRTAIYVLSKKTNDLDISADVVTPAPTGPNKPDVFFIKYKTPQEAIHAQHVIQAQYDQLGGTSSYSNEGFVPVQSVIGHLDAQGRVIVNPNANLQSSTQFISQGGASSSDILGAGLLPDQSQIDQVSGGRIQPQPKYLPPNKYKKY